MKNTVCLIAAVFLLDFSAPVRGITTDDLADICEAMESAITDISIEYTWQACRPPTLEDVRGTDVGITVGPQTCTWVTKRPFGERYLSITKESALSATGESSETTTMGAYNGDVGRRLTRMALLPGMKQGDGSRGSVSRASAPPRPLSQTPLVFSILGPSVTDEKTPLSSSLRREGFVDLNETVQEINGFSTVCASLLIDTPTIPAAHQQPYLRIYFAVDHDYTPVKYEYLSPSKSGPRPTFAVDVNSLEQVAKGMWFPISGSLIPAGSDVVRNVYKASKVAVNRGLKDDDFTFEFPPGTLVDDEIVGVQYVVKPVERQFDKWPQNDEWLGQADGRGEEKPEGGLTREVADVSGKIGEDAGSGQDVSAGAESRSMDVPAASTQSHSHILGALVAAVCILLIGVAVAAKRILF